MLEHLREVRHRLQRPMQFQVKQAAGLSRTTNASRDPHYGCGQETQGPTNRTLPSVVLIKDCFYVDETWDGYPDESGSGEDERDHPSVTGKEG